MGGGATAVYSIIRMPKLNYLSLSSVPRFKAQRRLHGGELGTELERGSARERDSERAVQLESGAGVQIRRTVGLNIPPPLQSLAFQKETEPRPVAYAVRRGAGENPPEHRLLGYWQSLVDHVEARLYHLGSRKWWLAGGNAHPRAVAP